MGVAPGIYMQLAMQSTFASAAADTCAHQNLFFHIIDSTGLMVRFTYLALSFLL